jgi:MFS family permease
MEALLAFFATLVSLRLSADLVRRYRQRPAPGLLAWAAALGAFAAGSGAIAWGSAADWSNPAFRVYYLFGGLLAAALLGAGSLQWAGVRWVGPLTLVYVGLAIGVAVAVPLTTPVGGSSIPEAQAHLALVPARILAITANSLGTLAAVVVAVIGIRRRPLGNSLILAGLVVAALGSALAGLGKAESSLFSAAAALLLYAGFVVPSRASKPRRDAHPESAGAAP